MLDEIPSPECRGILRISGKLFLHNSGSLSFLLSIFFIINYLVWYYFSLDNIYYLASLIHFLSVYLRVSWEMVQQNHQFMITGLRVQCSPFIHAGYTVHVHQNVAGKMKGCIRGCLLAI